MVPARFSCLRCMPSPSLTSLATTRPTPTEPSRDDIYDGGGIPLLANLLQRPNENIQANALWALINLTNNGARQRCEMSW